MHVDHCSLNPTGRSWFFFSFSSSLAREIATWMCAPFRLSSTFYQITGFVWVVWAAIFLLWGFLSSVDLFRNVLLLSPTLPPSSIADGFYSSISYICRTDEMEGSAIRIGVGGEDLFSSSTQASAMAGKRELGRDGRVEWGSWEGDSSSIWLEGDGVSHSAKRAIRASSCSLVRSCFIGLPFCFLFRLFSLDGCRRGLESGLLLCLGPRIDLQWASSGCYSWQQVSLPLAWLMNLTSVLATSGDIFLGLL